MLPSSRSGYFFAAATVLIWSGFVLMARHAGVSALNGYDLTALRFGTAAALLLPAWIFWKRVPIFNLRMLSLALSGGIAYSVVVYWSFHFAPGGHGAVLISGMLPFFMAACAWVVLGETPRRSLWLSLIVIALGMAALGVDTFRHSGSTWRGDLMMATSSLIWAIYTVLVRRFGYSPAETTIGVALLACLIYLPVYIVFLPKGMAQVPLSAVLAQAFYQGVLVVIVAMVFYMQAMVRLGPTRLGAIMAVVPAVAGLGAWLVLQEPLSAFLVAGLVLTSTGAWLGSR
jgi:drug/metabolite transporter (DMT)-like permease